MGELIAALRLNDPDAFRGLLSEGIKELGMTEVEELLLGLAPRVPDGRRARQADGLAPGVFLLSVIPLDRGCGERAYDRESAPTTEPIVEGLIQKAKKATPSSVKRLVKSAIETVNPLADKASSALTIGLGAVGASLSQVADIPFDAEQVSRITSAMKNYGLETAEAVKALPDELTKYGTEVVEQWVKGGDKNGKQWSHIESQANNPGRASDPRNGVWEDGSKNMARGSRDMTLLERVGASVDNHWDAFLTVVRTQEFWQRTLGNAFEASVYTSAVTAIDMLLIHRNELLNASTDRKKEIVVDILKRSGLMAAGALPVSVFLAVALLLIPGLSVVMAPLGVVGSVGLSVRLITSLVMNPSQQEKDLLTAVQGRLRGLMYDIQKSATGSVTITVQSMNAT